MENKSCFNCVHIHKETESWEMPHIFWYECSARPQNAQLKQFPFFNTKCKYHEFGKTTTDIFKGLRDGKKS